MRGERSSAQAATAGQGGKITLRFYTNKGGQ